MSKLSEYSKFDHIDSDSDDADEQEQAEKKQPQVATVLENPLPSAVAPRLTTVMRKDDKTGRYVFEFNGREVYQWEQTLDDVTIFVQAPPGLVRGKEIKLEIQPTHLRLGRSGFSQWFLDEPTFGKVDVSESTWSLEEGEVASGDENSNKIITIYLTKAHRGELWDAALRGNQAVQLDPAEKEVVKKGLMLERFQEENPGFDFRDATFNGSVPDARSFMGGVKYS